MQKDIPSLTIGMIARKWAYKYRGCSEQDIAQELHLWALQQKLDESWRMDDTLTAQEYETCKRKYLASLQWAAERYCRKDKAQRAGYSVEDEYFYPLKYLRELLEIYYSEGVTAHPPRGRAESVSKGGQDPAEGGGHLTAMLDVQRALQGLPGAYRQRLTLRYGTLAGYSDEKVAGFAQSEITSLTGLHPDTFRELMGLTRDTVRHRTGVALRALQRQLGGPSPWRRGVVSAQSG